MMSPNTPTVASRDLGGTGRMSHPRYRRLWLYSVVFTAFVSIAPLVIMTCVNCYQYSRALNEEMIHPVSQLTSNSKRFMNDFLKEHRAALAFVIERESYEDLCNQETLSRTFFDMKGSFGGFVDLGVIDSEGNQRSYVGPYKLEGVNHKDQDWFPEVCIRGVHISDVFMGHRHLPHFVIAVRKDSDNEGGFYILRTTIDTEVLNSYLSSLEIKTSSDVFLMNRDGVLQTPSRYHGGVLDRCPFPTPPFSLRPEVLEVVDKEGEPRLLGYAYIEQSPFIFVVLKRPEHVMTNWLFLRSDILWLLAVSIAIIMIVILWSSTVLVNRVREADLRRSKAFRAIAYNNKMASIGTMAAGVAHEINNPLAIIGENAGLLKDLVSIDGKPLERDRLLRIAELVLRSVARCSGITHRLLGFAKRMDPAVERVALGPLLKEVLSFHGKEAEYRRIVVTFNTPDDLPTIESDLGQLQQVFLNILSNAFAAVDDGGAIDIEIALADEDMVAVTIGDNGSGIPQENIEHIFEPFFSTKGDSGTGLGLSITYGIVENLGGRLDVKSAVDKGTVFTVTLPVATRRR